MKNKQAAHVFYALADLAVRSGMEFSFEQRNYASRSKALNGVLTESSSQDSGLVLRAWWPEESDQNGDATDMVNDRGDEEDDDETDA